MAPDAARGVPSTVWPVARPVLRVIRIPPTVRRLTENSETSAPPRRRDPRPPIIVIASRKIQVTNRASSEAATEIGPLVWSNATIHTGNVW